MGDDVLQSGWYLNRCEDVALGKQLMESGGGGAQGGGGRGGGQGGAGGRVTEGGRE